MRVKFDKQLNMLNLELIKMGSLCEDAIITANHALLENDEDAVKKVMEIESEIKQREREIEALSMRLLLQQQPVARDLRIISSALKMIYDMQRIGDQSRNIAEITLLINNEKVISKLNIADMAKATGKMVSAAIDSFTKSDLKMAKYVIEQDDIVDDLFDQIKDDLIDLMTKKKQNAEQYINLLLIAKYFEKIGDHAVNIANWVDYSITGVFSGDN